MNKLLIGTALFATLTLSGLSARASCVDPRGANQADTSSNFQPGPMPSRAGHEAFENIVGTWHVTYTTDGFPPGEAFIQWHSDGTEWENINHPVLGGNICMGSWKPLDRSHVSRNHYGWLYNNGVIAGYFNETETDLVSWDGNSYSGTNTTTLTFYPVPPATTPTVIVLTGTSEAKRIAP
ncbi:MAG TPA: hypothetical protein VMT29_23745 [Steroidobacteraceae bacterium]|nr:hypothetical protein [Steroidobacteraceae bacterium]